jgi:hypothetical protein
MKGFLHRIVQRATGAAVTVHSLARLPYGPQPVLAEPAIQMPASNRAARHVEKEANTALPGARSQRLPTTPPEDQRLPPPIPEIAAKARGDGEEPGAADGRQARRPRDLAMTEVVVAVSPRDETAPAAPELLANSKAQDVSLASLHLSAPLPPQASPTIRAREAPALHRAHGYARPVTVDEATEVHVSIGRIEVMAVHEAAPSNRQLPRAPRAMSLEDYLARRRGGGP